VYAVELGRKPTRMGLGPFGEAVFQTVLIAFLPIVGACSAALVLAMASSRANYASFIQYRHPVTVCFAVVPILLAFMLVKRLVWEYRDSRASVAEFGNRRDRLICNLQFWAVLLGSSALPWMAAAWGALGALIGRERTRRLRDVAPRSPANGDPDLSAEELQTIIDKGLQGNPLEAGREVAAARARGVDDTRVAAIACRLPLLVHPPQSFSAEFRRSLLAAAIDGITGTIAR
jgi:hypothetical protein